MNDVEESRSPVRGHHVSVPPGYHENEGPPYELDESRRQVLDVNDRNAGPDGRTETETR